MAKRNKYLKPINLFLEIKYKGYLIQRVVSYSDVGRVHIAGSKFWKTVQYKYTYYRTTLNGHRINSSLTLRNAKLFINHLKAMNA